MDDDDLLQAARAGDRTAIERLLRTHHDRVLGICRRLTGNEADALDACQEALIAIVRGLPRFDGRAAFSTWVYRVTTNACLDELRRRRRRPVPGLPDADGGTGSGGGPLAPAAGIEGLPDRMAIDTALLRLPEEFRVAVVLRDLCDLDYAEIASILDIPARNGQITDRVWTLTLGAPPGPREPRGWDRTSYRRPRPTP